MASLAGLAYTLRAIWNSRTSTPAQDIIAELVGFPWAFTSTVSAPSITLAGGTPLANYVEGSFTPAIVGTTTAGVGTYSAQSGRYTRLGNRCFFNLRVAWSAHTGTGGLTVGGLPFTSNAGSSSESTVPWFPNSAFMPPTNVLLIAIASTQITAWLTSGGARQNMTTAGDMWITGNYLL